jgi:hypothetical protein
VVDLFWKQGRSTAWGIWVPFEPASKTILLSDGEIILLEVLSMI